MTRLLGFVLTPGFQSHWRAVVKQRKLYLNHHSQRIPTVPESRLLSCRLVKLYLLPYLKQHENYFGEDLQILNRGQMARTTVEPAAPSSNFHPTPVEGHLNSKDLICTRPAYTSVIWWNRVSNLGHSSPEVECLPSGQFGSLKNCRIKSSRHGCIEYQSELNAIRCEYQSNASLMQGKSVG
ncbi:hypothetical protein AVEN_63238-1 [Araneus ventricosus]|uniref:Uncharacterized protein n=1 Tax=Araneus ventricosus TaxID=182803 RepID=A0A4Y2B1S3_ARAVE|nr:hypothetical protein AVEN_63238-1 [Araneus ventricosus]